MCQEVLGVTEVSAIVAAAGVLVGVAYYILDMRNQSKTRRTDLLVRVFSTMNSREWMEAWEKVRDREYLGYDDYKKKYGFVEANLVLIFFEQAGMLLEKKLIDIDLIPFKGEQVRGTYEKLKPLVEGSREKFREPSLMHGFEYLYNEIKKREQKLQQSKA